MTIWKQHLSATNETENGEQIPFYTKVQPEAVEEVAKKIDNINKEVVSNDILTSEEAEAMSAGAKSVGKFYLNFKVPKPHDKVPPERPVVSGCNSITSNIGKYTLVSYEWNLHQTPILHARYPWFLRKIEDINSQGILTKNALIATCDVISLFTIIPQDEGVQATRKVLNTQESQQVSTDLMWDSSLINLYADKPTISLHIVN